MVSQPDQDGRSAKERSLGPEVKPARDSFPVRGARLSPALGVLRRLRDDLAERGVVQSGIFGSAARGDDTVESDIDVVVHLGEGAAIDLIDVVRIGDIIRDAFNREFPGVRVDVSIYDDMRPEVRAEAEREAVYAD